MCTSNFTFITLYGDYNNYGNTTLHYSMLMIILVPLQIGNSRVTICGENNINLSTDFLVGAVCTATAKRYKEESS